MPRYRWLVVVVVTVVIAVMLAVTETSVVRGQEAAQSGSVDSVANEFPSDDGWAATLVKTGVQTAALQRARQTAPYAAETLRLLLSTRTGTGSGLIAGDGTFEDTLNTLASALAGDDPALAPRLAAMADEMRMYGQRDREVAGVRLAPVLDRLNRDLDQWPAEDAAVAARAIVRIRATLGLDPRDTWRERMLAVAARFPGTLTAAMIEVDHLSPPNTSVAEQMRRYDAYWRAHPGTAAGAYALFQKGFHLHVNVAITGMERRGSDPTDRLVDVAAIVKELETGPYPDGEWRRKAPELMTGFFVSSSPAPSYAPENIDRSLRTYADFVRARYGRDETWEIESSLAYVIETKMAALFELKGDRVGGVDRFYAELERESPAPLMATLARGLFLFRRGTTDVEARARGRAILTKVMSDTNGPEARRAAAELAVTAFTAGDRDTAASALDAFVSRWPDAAWTWVAHVRRGLLRYDAGLWGQAAEAFQQAGRSGMRPPARVFGQWLAGRALEGDQRFNEALAAYQLASDAFDPGYGASYRWYARLPQGNFPLTGSASFTKELLDTKALQLQQRLAGENGPRAARAAWLFDEGRFEEARAAAAGDRRLLHDIDFERALSLVAVTNATRDEAAARALLAGLSGPIEDGAMFAGQFAQSAIDFRQGRRDEAMATVERALDGWLKFQAQRIPARHSGVDADVVAIRQLLFRPLGDLDLFKDGWNAFSFPATLPRYLMVPADLVIVLPGEAAATRTVWQTFPDFPNTLFIEGADHARLSRVLDVVGGTARREPRQIMETPNQPIGVARDLATAWNALFPTRPGHWGGWELTAYPRITRITFVDADRTQALAAVTIGYSGATVVLEKVDGRWVARRLIDRWVT